MRGTLLTTLILLGGFLTGFAQGVNPSPTSYPIMHFTQQERQQMILDHLQARQITAPKGLIKGFASSLSLLPRLPYVPAERSQVSCQDCWQWAGTGVMEIANDVQNNMHNRLSVQFINSCQKERNCCEGGLLVNVVNFYNSEGFAIPWSNSNAQFSSQNGSGSCIACNSIATQPRYPINSISRSAITTWNVGKTQAINNIKSVLNQNKAVYFVFFMCTGPDWSQFKSFWRNQPETAVWTDFYCGQTWDPINGGGHAVLCVGYDDANRYWIMVNSWGTTSGRSNGLFRVSMDLDYDCSDASKARLLSWETLNIQFASVAPPLITRQPVSQSVLLGSNATFNVIATGTPPLSYQWRKDGTNLVGKIGTSLNLVNVQMADLGNYSVVVNNAYGTAISSNAVLTTTSPILYFVSSSLVGGDGDQSVEPGECNDLTVVVRNDGYGPATNVIATLTTTTPGVSVVQTNSRYPNIAVGMTATNTTAFRISASPSFVCSTNVNLTLTLGYGGGGYTTSFNLASGGTNYVITQSTGAIVSGTTDTGNHGDNTVTTISLPFNFMFYGQIFSNVALSANGNLQFLSTNVAYYNTSPPYGIFNYAILPFWDYLRTDGTGKGIFTLVSGSAPNRIFNIEWRAIYNYGGGLPLNFEVRLYEGQSRFDIIYGTLNGNGSSATVGVQKGRGMEGICTQFEFNTGGLTNGLQLTFQPLCTGAGVIYVDRSYQGTITNGTICAPFRTVTDGYQAAQNGNTICIFSNNYPEKILMTNKTLLLQATNGVVNIIGTP